MTYVEALMKWLLPIHYVHDLTWAYGWILFPWFPVSVGYFRDHGFRVAKMAQYHDCTIYGR